MDDNPFAAPEASPRAWPGARDLRTADPGARFVARLVDQFLLATTLIPWLAVYVLLGSPEPETLSGSTLLVLVPFAVVLPVFVAWQWYRQSVDGTTVGKRMNDIRIVNRDGGPPGFVAGVVLRVWVLSTAQVLLGSIGSVIGLVDALMVFTDQGRTLHDWLAGTRVVRQAAPREAAPTHDTDEFDLDE